MKTITDVINRLDNIEQECVQNRSRAGYFAALYKRMTMAVANGITTGAFEDGPRMERLDIIFAQRYIDAYGKYMKGGHCTQSWKLVFDNVTNNQLIVLQHLLLGINTHINLDLAIAAATCCPGAAIDGLQHDFQKINQLISNLAGDVQGALAKVWPPMVLLTKIANGTQDVVLNFSIDKAREASWSNACLLSQMHTDQQGGYAGQMDAVVAKIATGIQSPGFLQRILVKAIRATEYDDVVRTISLIGAVPA